MGHGSRGAAAPLPSLFQNPATSAAAAVALNGWQGSTQDYNMTGLLKKSGSEPGLRKSLAPGLVSSLAPMQSPGSQSSLARSGLFASGRTQSVSQFRRVSRNASQASPFPPMTPMRCSSAVSFSPKPAFNMPPSWSRLPERLRPTKSSIEVESAATSCSMAEASASLLVGPQAAQAMKMAVALGTEGFADGTLDLKAWQQQMAEVQEGAHEPVEPEKLLAAIALLCGTSGVTGLDASGLGAEAAPMSLRAFRELRLADLSGSLSLRSLDGLRSCGELRALDLSGCRALADLRPLYALPFLESLDVSRCVAVQTIKPLLVGRCEPAPASALPMSRPNSTASFHYDEDPARLLPEGPRVLSHPSLRWLSLCGCTGLQQGVAELSQCQRLEYVDLYGCLGVEPLACFAASKGTGMKTLIWPSADMLVDLANDQEWPEAMLADVFEAAYAAARAKAALAKSGRRGEGLPMLPLLSDRVAYAMAAASEALAEFSEVSSAVERTALPAEEAEDDAEAGSAPGEAVVDDRHARCRPQAFTRALLVHGFRPPEGVELSVLFCALDVDRDGALSLQDLCSLGLGPAEKDDTADALARLFSRHNADHNAAAADLSSGHENMSLHRIAECLIVNGVNDVVAERVATAVVHCAGDMEGPPEFALTQALGAYTVAHNAAIVADFLHYVARKYTSSKEAYYVLDKHKTGHVGWEEFQQRVAVAYKWSHDAPGALEAVFRALDMDGHGTFTYKDMAALYQFNVEQTLSSMTKFLRQVTQFPDKNPPAFHNCSQDLDGSGCVGGRLMVTRRDFVNAWEAVRDSPATADANAKIAFGLLDLSGSNILQRSEVMTILRCLQRRAEAFALCHLASFLHSRFDSLEVAHKAFMEAETLEVDCPLEHARNKSREGRRHSSGRLDRKRGSASR